jgi:predicted RNase H-like HicB family nuclease
MQEKAEELVSTGAKIYNQVQPMKQLRIVIEKHADGCVAYPVGIKDVVVGEGGSFDEALRDVQSALRFHIETFGTDALEPEGPVLDAFIADAAIV